MTVEVRFYTEDVHGLSRGVETATADEVKFGDDGQARFYATDLSRTIRVDPAHILAITGYSRTRSGGLL